MKPLRAFVTLKLPSFRCGATESTARKTSGRRLGSDGLQLCQLLATAVAIDGQIYNDADYQPVGPDAEIHLIPRIGGG